MQLSNKWYSSADFQHAKGNSIYKDQEHLRARMRKRGGEKINRDSCKRKKKTGYRQLSQE